MKEIIKIHTKILELFYHNFPELIKSMQNADHNYDYQNLNPYHLEGNVWTHTMMVYSEAIKSGAGTEVLFAALLHDIGKPQARRVKDETKRVQFFGHEGLSFYKAIDVLNHECYAFLELSSETKVQILKLIALHSELFNWKNSGDNSDARFKNDQQFLNLLSEVVENDYRGRLSLDPLHPNQTWKGIKKIQTDELPVIALNQKQITLLIGPPCSGKSTYCESMLQYNYTRISRDDLVLELGAQKTYNECWNIVDQQEVDKLLMSRYQTAVRNGENILVDMTNMSKKSRRKWVNDSKIKKLNYWKTAIVFCTGEQTIIERLYNQKNHKNIPVHVLDNMMKRFGYPMYDEFDSIIHFI